MHTHESIINLTRDSFDALDAKLVQERYVWWARSYYASAYQSLDFRETYAARFASVPTERNRQIDHAPRVLIFDNQHYLSIGEARNSHLQCIVEIMREAHVRGMHPIYTLCAEPSAWPFETPSDISLSAHLAAAITTLYDVPCTPDQINDLERDSRCVKIRDYPFYLAEKVLEIAPGPNDVIIGIGWGSFAFHQLVQYIQTQAKFLVKLSMDIKPGNFLESGYHTILEPGLSAAECWNHMCNDCYNVIRVPYEIGLFTHSSDAVSISIEETGLLADIANVHTKGSSMLFVIAALHCQQKINADFMNLLQALLSRGHRLLLIGITDYDHIVVHSLRRIAHESTGEVFFQSESDNIQSLFRRISTTFLSVVFLAPHHTGNGRTILTAADEGIPVFIKPPSDAKHRLCKMSCYSSSADLMAVIDRESFTLAHQLNYKVFPEIVKANNHLIKRECKTFSILLGPYRKINSGTDRKPFNPSQTIVS